MLTTIAALSFVASTVTVPPTCDPALPTNQLVACLACALGRVDQPRGDDVGTEPAELLLESALIPLQPLVETLELRPVRRQADAEHADARAQASDASPACRRALMLRRRNRARP